MLHAGGNAGQLLEFRQRHGRAQRLALAVVHADVFQCRQHQVGLHRLGHTGNAQFVRQHGEGAQHGLTGPLMDERFGEGAVDLQVGHADLADGRQVHEAAPYIVQRGARAQLAQTANQALHHVAVLHGHGLVDLDDQFGRNLLVAPHLTQQIGLEGFVAERLGRQVERDEVQGAEGAFVPVQPAQGLVQHPAVDGGHLAPVDGSLDQAGG